jgi:hypothetical protein
MNHHSPSKMHKIPVCRNGARVAIGCKKKFGRIFVRLDAGRDARQVIDNKKDRPHVQVPTT